MRCQIILRHRDGIKLRELYEKIIESSDADVDSFVSSEAARTSWRDCALASWPTRRRCPTRRMGLQPTSSSFRTSSPGTPAWSGISKPVWPVEAADFIPARWSRRRPSPTDDMKSVVYLCCPVQTTEGWSFITALTTFLKGDWDGVDEQATAPGPQARFQRSADASIFKEIHNLGNWVVNYDELLDRRQLLNQNVKVIRYKQSCNAGPKYPHLLDGIPESACARWCWAASRI